MSLPLPAIDAHAHVLTTVPPRELRGLGAMVLAVTREPSEWHAVLKRRDDLALWAIGAHPGLPRAIAAFDADQFAVAACSALAIGEVGLDGRSKVPMAEQRRVLDAVLEGAASTPLPVSIHSVEASKQVLDALERQPIAAPILHWWRGNAQQTARAVEMGCFFSLNGAEARRPKVIDLVPPDRVLTETDFPHTRRSDPAARQPAAVQTIEDGLAERWSVSRLELRRRLWRTFGTIVDQCGLFDRLPGGVQDGLLTAGGPT